jgi:hypothetical protein
MTKSKDASGTGEVKDKVLRRDLVTIVEKPEFTERPFHIYAKSNGALLARVDKESIIDSLLDRLDESVFHRK